MVMKKGIKSGEGIGKGRSEAEREVVGGGWIGAERGKRGQSRAREVGWGLGRSEIYRDWEEFLFFFVQ